MSRVWTTSHILCLIALLLLVVAFVTSMGWISDLHNWEAWVTAGLCFFVASLLPWRSTP